MRSLSALAFAAIVIIGLPVRAMEAPSESPWRNALREADSLMAKVEPPLGESYVLAAETLYRAALEAALEGGEPSTEVAVILLRLADNQTALGRIGSSIRLQQQALEKAIEGLGPSSVDLCPFLNALGNSYHSQGRHKEGRALFRQCLESRRRALGEDSLDVAESLTLLGAADVLEGDWEAGTEKYREALRILQISLPDDSESVQEAKALLRQTLMDAKQPLQQ